MLWLKFTLISWTCWILVQLNSVYVNFKDFWNKFSFIFGQLCDTKTCAFVIMEIGKKVVWAEGGMGTGVRRGSMRDYFRSRSTMQLPSTEYNFRPRSTTSVNICFTTVPHSLLSAWRSQNNVACPLWATVRSLTFARIMQMKSCLLELTRNHEYILMPNVFPNRLVNIPSLKCLIFLVIRMSYVIPMLFILVISCSVLSVLCLQYFI